MLVAALVMCVFWCRCLQYFIDTETDGVGLSSVLFVYVCEDTMFGIRSWRGE